MQRMFPSYHNSIPESFLDLVIEDVYSASAWQEEGRFSGDIQSCHSAAGT